MPIIKSINFKKDYRCFPEGTSFDFEGANFVVIMGANGSGKTTLLKIIENQFKKEDFFNRKDADIQKSCKVVLDESIDSKKTTTIMLDYLHNNPKNAMFLSGDNEDLLIMQSQYMSSGQTTQVGMGQKMGKFLYETEGKHSVLLFDQPETGLDVGAMVQICFAMMIRLATSKRQIVVTTHSSDWIRAMYLAYYSIGEEFRERISFRFIDILFPEIRIDDMEQAVIHTTNKQSQALEQYLVYINDMAKKQQQADKRAKKRAEKQKSVAKKPSKQKQSE